MSLTHAPLFGFRANLVGDLEEAGGTAGVNQAY